MAKPVHRRPRLHVEAGVDMRAAVCLPARVVHLANALKQSCIFLRSRAARPITPDWYPRNIDPPYATSGQHHHPQSPESSAQKHHAAGIDRKSAKESSDHKLRNLVALPIWSHHANGVFLCVCHEFQG